MDDDETIYEPVDFNQNGQTDRWVGTVPVSIRTNKASF